jgi:hypothetical protein
VAGIFIILKLPNLADLNFRVISSSITAVDIRRESELRRILFTEDIILGGQYLKLSVKDISAQRQTKYARFQLPKNNFYHLVLCIDLINM